MNINEINQYINQYIYENDTQQITPTRLNAVLKTVTNGLDEIKLDVPTITSTLSTNDDLVMWRGASNQPYLLPSAELRNTVTACNNEADFQKYYNDGLDSRIYFINDTNTIRIGKPDGDGWYEIPSPDNVDLSNYYNKTEVDTKINTLPTQEFVKNGLGWALKYKVDNPEKYLPTGENAIDLTKAYPDAQTNVGASGKDSFTVGSYNLAAGLNSISMGYSTKAYGSVGIVIGYNSTAYSPFSSIFGGFRNTIGYEELLTTPITGLNTRTTIVGGADNKILRTQYSSIIGGSNNTIDAGENYVANTTAYNNIIGGYNNQIIKNSSRSNILGGQNNISQGWYNNVSGLENHAVTLGETIFGTYATIQDTNLPPNEFGNQNSTNRMFSVGIGGLINSTSYRADGLNIYKNGLVTIPSITSELINNNPKAVITKEYSDSQQVLVKSGGGYKLKDKLINEALSIGNNSIDLSTGDDYRVPQGSNSFSFGVNNAMYYDNTIMLTTNGESRCKDTSIFGGRDNEIGMTTNVSATQYSTILGGNKNRLDTGRNSVILGGENNKNGHGMMAASPNDWGDNNSVIGGNTNFIIQTKNSTVIGGEKNTIGFYSGTLIPRNGENSTNNIILGGDGNQIISRNENINAPYSSIILAGANNISNGHYNVVGGVGNEAVTYGETLFGIYATTQNYNNNNSYNEPDGWQRLETARIFGVGIGSDGTNRKDAINVYNNGLVTAPGLTIELMNNNPKSLITKEYLTPQLLINILTTATEEEKTEIKTLLNI